jgi:hypothetical protein
MKEVSAMGMLSQFFVALIALTPSAAVSASQDIGTDLHGWEAARWGMSETALRQAFGSKLLVELDAAEPNATALGMPGYVFLGCPFDVTFHLSQLRGLVRVELNRVHHLSGHGGDHADYETACGRIIQSLELKYGPAQQRHDERDWTFPSAKVTAGGVPSGQVYIDYRARADSKEA